MTRPAGLFILAALVSEPALGQRPMPSHPATPPATRVVARVNGQPLTAERLAMAADSLLPIASYHRNVSPERLAEIRRNALRNLIDEELQHQDAVRRGVRVTAAEVERSLNRARSGYKSPLAWEAARRRSGVALATLRREIRRVLMIRKAYEQAVLAVCSVSAAETARFYRENPDRFLVPEQRRVYLITLGVDPGGSRQEWQGAWEQARDLLDRVRAGESFEDLARQHSTDDSRSAGGDLGFLHSGRMSNEFESAIAILLPGETSEPFQTIYGVHLVRVAERRAPQQKTFEEVKAKLQADLTDRRCAERNDEWTAALRARAEIVVLDESLR